MHEFSIVEAMLTAILERAKREGAKKIHKINLVVGELSGIEEGAFQFYFQFLSRETIASGAILFFTQKKAKLRCRNCNTIFTPKPENYECPNCTFGKIEILSGRELYIESMEIE